MPIKKTVAISPPMDDAKTVQIERMLATVFSKSLQHRTGTYTGDGRDGRALTIGLSPIMIYIGRSAAGSGNGVFAIEAAPGVSFVPGSGFVGTAVKTFTPDGVTLGISTDCNGIGVSYTYLALG